MTFTPRALLGDEKPDPNPAADPALDALARILNRDALTFHEGYTIDAQDADIATIRDALADRITPAEARTLIEWGEHWTEGHPTPSEITLIARLGRIADQEAKAWPEKQRARFPHDCPRCGAKVGAPCYSTPGHGSHAERPRETGR